MNQPVDLPPAAYAAHLGDLDAHTRRLDIDTRDITAESAFVVERYRDDERIEIQSLERHLPNPLFPRGTVTVHDPADFAQLVNRLADPHHSTLWADIDNNSVTAVFDDHALADVAGWRNHTARLALKVDPDWALWLGSNAKLGTQEWFADFLEQVAHTVIAPDAATMIEVATTFRATQKCAYSGGVRLKSGDVEFAYKEDTDAKAGISGKLEIPDSFTVRVSPWVGVDAVELTARLRYRLHGGTLGIGYSLLRPDRAKQDAFALILNRMRENVNEDVPLFKGNAPSPVTPNA